jgi:NADH-quinone oxidoreductase subunit E
MTTGSYGTQLEAQRSPAAARPDGDFAFTPASEKKAEAILARYPQGREHSAIMPLFWLAQEQMRAETGVGWLPVPVIEYCAKRVGMPYIRAYEVATFYTMFNLEPTGRFHIEVCGTTPCWLRGSDEVFRACHDHGLRKGHVTNGGAFSLAEVECLGACVNAPMCQVNAEAYFEDLDYDRTRALLTALEQGQPVKPGPQNGRQFSAPEGGPTTLMEVA